VPVFIIGLALAAAGVGSYFLLRPDRTSDLEKPEAEKPLPDDESVKIDAVSLGTSASRSSTESAAEAPLTRLPEKLATESKEGFMSSPEMAHSSSVTRVPTPAFLDAQPFDPARDATTLPLGMQPTLDLDAPFVDTLSQPRDLANAPLNGNLGDLDSELGF
jgi:hypothetical protein